MIILDTTAFISLSIAEILEETIKQHSVHTTEEVISELEEISQQDDYLAEAAENALQSKEEINIHQLEFGRFQTNRIDSGEASCLALTREIDPDFLFTDDLHAMAEIKKLSSSEVAISPIMLQSMVKNNSITKETASNKLDKLMETRDRMGTPIYRRAKNQLEE
ncbi:PIN domain-containing protein [Candidatus Nanohalobium constans]|uniref:PIN domain-containing protein n=1 Tax=Candidatus Nanohalobium constans TaxID=2565781 RepID=A0A5Q0UH22_9ARCH|nr:PIN domain-containing protein [Candidatus Nanohalobium constans]QGA80917.1 hypothetical protein LC1Nh_1045 [Candidatus Nanohalobium constans]